MKQYLVKWNDNWADEMDLEGWVIMNQDELDEWKKRLQKPGRVYLCFGTNEDNEYESGQEILDCCEITEISDSDAEVLNRLIGGAYGFTDFADAETYDDVELDYLQ